MSQRHMFRVGQFGHTLSFIGQYKGNATPTLHVRSNFLKTRH